MLKKPFWSTLKNPYSNKPCEAGRRFQPVFGFVVDNDTGEEILTEISKVDVQEQIDAFAESCTLSHIIDRFLKGDDSQFNAMRGRAFYDDITNIPSNMHDVHTMLVEQRQHFNELPYEDRAFFNNDFNQYLDSIGNGRFNSWLDKKFGSADPEENTPENTPGGEDIE